MTGISMELYDYINSFPRRSRREVRQYLAQAHGVSEVTIRAWANGTRRHPCHFEAIAATERATRGEVTRYDLRPDIFGKLIP